VRTQFNRRMDTGRESTKCSHTFKSSTALTKKAMKSLVTMEKKKARKDTAMRKAKAKTTG